MKETLGGLVGTSLSVTAVMTATNDVLYTISLICTILGAVVSFIVVPFLNWLRLSREDGKITADEVKHGAEIVSNGIEEVKNAVDEAGKDKRKDG